jgi:hypothetical protein
MLVTRPRVLAAALCCAMTLIAAPAAGAAGNPSQPQPQVLWNAYPIDPATTSQAHGAKPSTGTQPRSERAAVTTTRRDTPGAAKRSSVLKIIVVVAAVVVGIVVGLIPALLLGVVLGVAPRPRWVRPRRRVPPAPARPAARRLPTPNPRVVFEPRAVEAEVVPVRALVPAQVQASLAVPDDDEAVTARERHREIYDAAYAEQLSRVDTLRRTIATGLAITAASRPVDDAPPVTEPDE